MEPTTRPKTRRIEIRLSDEERDFDAAAASVLGESFSTRSIDPIRELSDGWKNSAAAREQSRRGHRAV